jgi:hypothetical protein
MLLQLEISARIVINNKFLCGGFILANFKELSRIIPNSEPKWRSNSSIKKMVKDAVKRGFTDIGNYLFLRT